MFNIRRALVPRSVGRLISKPVNIPSARTILTPDMPKVRKPRRKR